MAGAANAAYRAQHNNGQTVRTRYQKPAHHWEGFGRKSTIPSWYDPSLLDNARR